MLVACKSDYDAPCRNQAVQQTFKLTSADAARFPYQKGDTIGFVSAQSDTIIFYVDTLVSYDIYKTTTVKGNPECPPDVDAYHSVQARLRDAAKTVAMSITFSKSTDSAIVQLPGNTIGFPILFIGDSLLRFSDSVEVVNRKFYKVNTIVSSNGDTLMVNASNGIVRFSYLGKPFFQYKYNNK